MLFEAGRSALLIIDVQEKLVATMHEPEPIIANCRRLMQAAHRLDIPILASEHYPKGLGRTVPELAPLVPEGGLLEKIHFSCLSDTGYRARFEMLGRAEAVVAGLETHVCVMQTSLQLRDAGYAVAVVADAVTSRDPRSKTLAIERLRQAGVAVVGTEMLLFEWLHKGGTPEFKDVLELIR